VRIARLAAALLLTASLAVGVGAQPAAPISREPGSEITVSLITFGVGHEVFERFGHNALRFQNSLTGEDVAFHWGLFSFTEPGFLMRFLTGDTKYWMGAVDPTALLESERRAGRPTTIQRLNLTPAQALKLRQFVAWNSLDENKFYRYDYYRDNCSTRLRDALDSALGGVLRRASDSARTELSYRNESIRLTEGDAPVQWGIDVALGRPADAPLTKWESYFIPMRLRDGLREIRVTGADGVEVPLVAGEQVPAMPLGVTPVPEAPTTPTLFWRYLLVGLLLAGFIVVLRIAMISRRWAAWVLGLFGSIWSLLCGVLGVVLLLAWFATRHQFWAKNETDLLLTPLSLALVVLVPMSLIWVRGERAARMLAAVVAILGLFALVLALVPGGQQSPGLVAMLLPPHLALAWSLGLPNRRVP
jgi:hypothetical protein